jgi:8-oxo-dGTP pyrophosphatase MutT (NUDIX family)
MGAWQNKQVRARRRAQDATMREGVVRIGRSTGAWRDAATVIVWVRLPSSRRAVLMLERPATQPGWPSYWVFPGGGVRAGDRQAEVAPIGDEPWPVSDLTAWMTDREQGAHGIQQDRFMTWAAPHFERRLGYVPVDVWPRPDRDPIANRAAWVAAARELWEETGVWLAHAPSVPAVVPQQRLSWWPGDEPPHLHWLQYHGRLATPPHEALRFDCRFFSLDLTEAAWPAVWGTPGEVEQVRWVEPRNALRQLRLALPTQFVLEHLEEIVAAPGAGA